MKMKDDQFELWCLKNNIIDPARMLIERIRSSQPERNVRSGKKNVSGTYSSHKMGHTVQYESHGMELPFIHKCEYDNNILEYWDQPNKIKLDYVGLSKGVLKRKPPFLYTPDFFVIWQDDAGWVECKPEDKLQKLSEADPYRYHKDESGEWRCPPGEAYAEMFNLSFKVFSSSDINWKLDRNLRFLGDYFDNKIVIPEEIRNRLFSVVRNNPGIRLKDLLDSAKKSGFDSDHIYTSISIGDLYIDLQNHVLAKSEDTPVFIDAVTAAAYIHIAPKDDWMTNNISGGVQLEINKTVIWDSKPWKIINTGEKMVWLRSTDGHISKFTYAEIESLLKEGEISGLNKPAAEDPYVTEAFRRANKADHETATAKLEIIRPYLEGDTPKNSMIPKRTIRYWLSKYRKHEKRYGVGYIGLLPHEKAKGNRERRLNQDTMDLMETWIEKNYESFKKPNMKVVWERFNSACFQQGTLSCSYKAFTEAVHARPRHEQTAKRTGDKAAYEFESWFLDYHVTSIRHGDRPFEIGHIDHTQLDILLIDSQTKEVLDKPWLTLLLDAFSRKILSLYLTYDPPSYRSSMMVNRECVKRTSRLPETFVVDGGKDFAAVYFDQLLARYGSGKKVRSASKPRSGTLIERIFNTTNTRFIHNLQGNTQITKNVRQITKDNNPKTLAVWTLGMLTERLSQYAFEVYNETPHPALRGLSPNGAFAQGLQNSGDRSFVRIPYDDNFRMLTLPLCRRGTALVIAGRGFKHNYQYYSADALREVEGKRVEVRYDPYNLSVAYAYVKNQWVECISSHYADFDGKTEKQLKIATDEILKNKQIHNSGRKYEIDVNKIAELLNGTDSDELRLQKMKDRELHGFTVVSGGTSSLSSKSQTKTNRKPPAAKKNEINAWSKPLNIEEGRFF